VWQLVQHQQRLNRTPGAVTLSNKLAAEYGITPTTKWHAIRRLAEVGLLSVADQGKRCAQLLFPVDLSVEQCEQQIALLDASRPKLPTKPWYPDKVVSIQAARLKRSGASRRS
jgi:hypothetical protein